jgi:membrane protein YqaA with SNARE-associated domain
LKRFFAHVLVEWKLVILPALLKWGIWGVGAVAVLDSSSIPVPMDAILALYVWNDKPHFWFYCLMAAAGSALGGLLPYGLGRAGGELFLLKRVNRAKFDRMRDRFERQEFLAVMIPSMMPPPAPWKVFVFASGVFEMRVLDFLLAVFVGRALRWFALALLVLKLGPGAADMVAHHSFAAVAVIGALAVAGFLWWWIRFKRANKPTVDPS